MNNRILMLPRFGRQGANSRYRLWQYVPRFEQAGFDVTVQPMLDDDYLEALYKDGRRPSRSVIKGYLRQLGRLFTLRAYDAVLLDQELLPYFPSLFERMACLANSRVIVDYDDAAYCKYEKIPVLRSRIKAVMRAARAVVVGNHHLADYASDCSRDTRLIPTVIDLDKYPVAIRSTEKGRITICWIGTPITASRYLPSMVPVFAEIQRRFPEVIFRFIGSGKFSGSAEIQGEILPWSEKDEGRQIADSDIGIMPIPDAAFERGKCGLKLIQYMGARLPVISSPVGENLYIVEHGREGFHAVSSAEWIECLSALVQNPDLRHRMGSLGRSKVQARYSLESGFQQWHTLLLDVGLRTLDSGTRYAISQ